MIAWEWLLLAIAVGAVLGCAALWLGVRRWLDFLVLLFVFAATFRVTRGRNGST